MKSTTKKSFQMSGPLRSVRVHGGAGGVRVALNGQEVVSVRNAAPGAPGGAGAGQQQPVTDELSTIKIGRFIAEQQQSDQPAATPTDNGNDDKGQEIVVGPITPIPAPKPQPIARLGL